ncbi:MAG: hypothetical protein EOM12_17135 [Verrucomicrobiae bacterium]|nr:hypothetical protein [Verrucomicrobiae bacterium]
MSEIPSCYSHKIRTARKENICCECKGIIEPGETYHYHHGVWDHVGQGFKVCMECEALRAECDKGLDYDSERTPFTGLRDSVEGMIKHAPELYLQFVEIKRKREAEIPLGMASGEAFAKQLKTGKE